MLMRLRNIAAFLGNNDCSSSRGRAAQFWPASGTSWHVRRDRDNNAVIAAYTGTLQGGSVSLYWPYLRILTPFIRE